MCESLPPVFVLLDLGISYNNSVDSVVLDVGISYNNSVDSIEPQVLDDKYVSTGYYNLSMRTASNLLPAYSSKS